MVKRIQSFIGPNPTWDPYVEVVDIRIIHMYSMCKFVGCWFWTGCWFSIIYLKVKKR